jgi:hypothetical protein
LVSHLVTRTAIIAAAQGLGGLGAGERVRRGAWDLHHFPLPGSIGVAWVGAQEERGSIDPVQTCILRWHTVPQCWHRSHFRSRVEVLVVHPRAQRRGDHGGERLSLSLSLSLSLHTHTHIQAMHAATPSRITSERAIARERREERRVQHIVWDYEREAVSLWVSGSYVIRTCIYVFLSCFLWFFLSCVLACFVLLLGRLITWWQRDTTSCLGRTRS